MNFRSAVSSLAILMLVGLLAVAVPAGAQTITATLQGQVLDSSGGAIPNVQISAVNKATGFSRKAVTTDTGNYNLEAMPVGDYAVTVEIKGFKAEVKEVTLQVGQVATLNFTLAVGEVSQSTVVQATSEVTEPTRTQISEVITRQQIENLPVNGRQFIDFVLLAPGVSIGDTTSGSTDVIVEPVTKISFASQNIHYNFVAIDGADNMSTASGIQKTTPSQEAVQEFRVINAEYSTVFGRSAAGVVNIITKSGTNDLHGSLYSYFRNDAFDAISILAAPKNHKLQQYQFGGALGGPIVKDKTFYFANYEGQRRTESPFYNSTVLKNITAINNAKKNLYNLPPENLSVLRDSNSDNVLVKIDDQLTAKHNLSVRYFFNDARFTNVSPLNDGFDLPSAFKNNFLRDQSLVGSLISTLSPAWINEMRMQFAHRSFDFPVVSTQPHLEVANTFTVGVNRGNPDFYNESRYELVDNVTKLWGKHTISFGGNFNWVRTTESFPLFYPFEADFGTLNDLVNGTPFVIFFERFQAPKFNEKTINPAVYQGGRIANAIRNQAKGVMDHTYNGFFIQDKARVTNRLTVNFGVRYDWETWPSSAVNTDPNNIDPRAGFAYNLGTKWNVVVRGGFGMYHGTIPSPLLSCQIPSCGGRLPYPGRESIEDTLNATTGLFAFASGPFITKLALLNLLGQPNALNPAPTTGTYPDGVPSSFLMCPGQPAEDPPIPPGTLAGCGFFGDAVIVRFVKNHQAPLSYQTGLGFEFQPMRNFTVNASYLHVRGERLGSFFNVNQPNPTGQVMVHNSGGAAGLKNTYFCPTAICGPGIPGVRNPRFAVYFEAASRWDSVYDGLLVTVDRRAGKYVNFGLSYTFSKGLDNGPNPSFVLIPQDSKNFRAEKAFSADYAKSRFTGNTVFTSPHDWNVFLRDSLAAFILTLESPHYFTKFAGFDANGDVFGNNDRVGIEPRNTFRGDSLKTLDVRLARTLPIREKLKMELIAEAFNLFNSVNVRFFNTVYGAADFCPFNPTATGCPATPSKNREGSPNPAYGTPRAVYNPRQLQFAVRFTF